MRDHKPITVLTPMGAFDRGGDANFDVAPLNYQTRCQNCRFTTLGGVGTREGSDIVISTGLAGIRRFKRYKRLNEADRFLVLDNTGKLFDSSQGYITPILNIPSMIDFSLQVMFDRAYISPHNGLKGLPGEFVYVYEGTGLARKAGGAIPTGFVIAAATGVAGKVERGQRAFAIIYETSSGHLTKAGPEPYVIYNHATGGFKVDLSNIQPGPAGTIYRHVVVTKAAPTAWNGDVRQLELFFLPDTASKLNNVVTTYTADFYDSELVSSADFTRDELADIPAGLGLFEYHGRLGVHTFDNEESMVRFSEVGYPEAHNSLAGFIKVKPQSGGRVTCCVEHRSSLYIHKDVRTFMTQDSGSEPSTWAEPIPVDKARGTPSVAGSGNLLDEKGSSSDWFPVADRSGLYAFSGTYPGVEEALTYAIAGFWARINPLYWHLVQVKVDPILSRIYVACPLDTVTFNNCIMMGDYQRGINAQNMRWSLWFFPADPDSIELDLDYATKKTILFFADKDSGVIYQTEDGLTNDWNNAIDSFTITSGLGRNSTGNINHYTAVRSRIRGAGSVSITLVGPDGIKTETVSGWALVLSPGGKYTRIINFEAEQLHVFLRCTALDNWFFWNELTVFSIPVWEELPNT